MYGRAINIWSTFKETSRIIFRYGICRWMECCFCEWGKIISVGGLYEDITFGCEDETRSLLVMLYQHQEVAQRLIMLLQLMVGNILSVSSTFMEIV